MSVRTLLVVTLVVIASTLTACGDAGEDASEVKPDPSSLAEWDENVARSLDTGADNAYLCAG